ncbi:oligosaccharide flippase family protein [Pedobacter sp. JCM 36344]|uniref:oligosaccharide flippase family protein n=1 Tax=Pedobacter sp. JCM 36344 TaxID=3374280 RepID=UPI003979053F
MPTPSLKRNIVANYSSQIFTITVSILTLPKLIAIMGAEAYGLVAFFMLMQSWLMLLDLGMSPTLTREISRYNGGALSGSDLLRFFHFLKKIFIGLSLLIFIVIAGLSDVIASSWLKTQLIDHRTLVYCVVLMAAILAIRWVTSIYKAVVTGFEKLVWLSIFNSGIAALRFLGVFIVLLYVDKSPMFFFSYQLIVGIIEIVLIIRYAHKLLPLKSQTADIKSTPLKALLGFSMTIAFTSAVWVIVTQTDKLILSKLLTLSEFGYYALAVQLASGISLIASPISSAILPRLTRFEAESKHNELIALYRQCTQMVTIICGTLALILIFFSNQLLYAWTGSSDLVAHVAPYLRLYAVGNLFLAFAAFPYYLQYAKGNLTLHLYGNLGFIIFLVPSLIFVVNKFGGLGAGYVWIFVNASYLFIYVPFINHKFDPHLNKLWYLNDLLKPLVPGILIALLAYFFIPISGNRFVAFFELSLIALSVLCVCMLSSDKLRGYINIKSLKKS